MFVYLCEVYVCVNIPGFGPVDELYMRTYNVVLFLAFAGLNQGQALRSLPPGVSSSHSKADHVSVPGCALGSKGRCGKLAGGNSEL